MPDTKTSSVVLSLDSVGVNLVTYNLDGVGNSGPALGTGSVLIFKEASLVILLDSQVKSLQNGSFKPRLKGGECPPGVHERLKASQKHGYQGDPPVR